MDPVTIGTVAVTVVTGFFSWFRASKAQREATTAEAARKDLRWAANLAVATIQATARNRMGAEITDKQARELLTAAATIALKLLAPKRAKIEKALGIDATEVIRAEIELALANQKALKVQR